jgi:A/G-specific adenine glycosylase
MKKRTPYSVWISEIMLQQTVVKSVIPFYRAWMGRFPDIRTLSRASLQTVLRTWEGLGYYSRARNIHRTAKIINNKGKGRFPNTEDELMSLPGIGTYTAAAILSLAFNKPFPVLDTNVKRVVRRLLAIRKESSDTDRKLVDWLRKRIPKKSAGDFNEALMELGQRICSRTLPQCPICAVRNFCSSKDIDKARVTKTPEKVKIKKIFSLAVIFLAKGRILLEKKERKLLSGLWTLPLAGKQDLNLLLEKFRVQVDGNPRFLDPIVHYYTVHRHTLQPVVVRVTGFKAKLNRNFRWVSLDNLERYPTASVYRKIFSSLKRDVPARGNIRTS